MQVNGGTAFAFAPPVNNSMATDSRTRVQSALEHIAGHLKCSLCYQAYKNPHTAASTCGHTFCWDCVLERLEGPGINKSICPQCSAPMWKKDLVRDIQIEQLLLITSRFCKEADRKASVECTEPAEETPSPGPQENTLHVCNVQQKAAEAKHAAATGGARSDSAQAEQEKRANPAAQRQAFQNITSEKQQPSVSLAASLFQFESPSAAGEIETTGQPSQGVAGADQEQSCPSAQAAQHSDSGDVAPDWLATQAATQFAPLMAVAESQPFPFDFAALVPDRPKRDSAPDSATPTSTGEGDDLGKASPDDPFRLIVGQANGQQQQQPMETKRLALGSRRRPAARSSEANSKASTSAGGCVHASTAKQPHDTDPSIADLMSMSPVVVPRPAARGGVRMKRRRNTSEIDVSPEDSDNEILAAVGASDCTTKGTVADQALDAALAPVADNNKYTHKQGSEEDAQPSAGPGMQKQAPAAGVIDDEKGFECGTAAADDSDPDYEEKEVAAAGRKRKKSASSGTRRKTSTAAAHTSAPAVAAPLGRGKRGSRRRTAPDPAFSLSPIADASKNRIHTKLSIEATKALPLPPQSQQVVLMPDLFAEVQDQMHAVPPVPLFNNAQPTQNCKTAAEPEVQVDIAGPDPTHLASASDVQDLGPCDMQMDCQHGRIEAISDVPCGAANDAGHQLRADGELPACIQSQEANKDEIAEQADASGAHACIQAMKVATRAAEEVQGTGMVKPAAADAPTEADVQKQNPVRIQTAAGAAPAAALKDALQLTEHSVQNSEAHNTEEHRPQADSAAVTSPNPVQMFQGGSEPEGEGDVQAQARQELGSESDQESDRLMARSPKGTRVHAVSSPANLGTPAVCLGPGFVAAAMLRDSQRALQGLPASGNAVACSEGCEGNHASSPALQPPAQRFDLTADEIMQSDGWRNTAGTLISSPSGQPDQPAGGLSEAVLDVAAGGSAPNCVASLGPSSVPCAPVSSPCEYHSMTPSHAPDSDQVPHSGSMDMQPQPVSFSGACGAPDSHPSRDLNLISSQAVLRPSPQGDEVQDYAAWPSESVRVPMFCESELEAAACHQSGSPSATPAARERQKDATVLQSGPSQQVHPADSQQQQSPCLQQQSAAEHSACSTILTRLRDWGSWTGSRALATQALWQELLDDVQKEMTPEVAAVLHAEAHAMSRALAALNRAIAACKSHQHKAARIAPSTGKRQSDAQGCTATKPGRSTGDGGNIQCSTVETEHAEYVPDAKSDGQADKNNNNAQAQSDQGQAQGLIESVSRPQITNTTEGTGAAAPRARASDEVPQAEVTAPSVSEGSMPLPSGGAIGSHGMMGSVGAADGFQLGQQHLLVQDVDDLLQPCASAGPAAHASDTPAKMKRGSPQGASTRCHSPRTPGARVIQSQQTPTHNQSTAGRACEVPGLRGNGLPGCIPDTPSGSEGPAGQPQCSPGLAMRLETYDKHQDLTAAVGKNKSCPTVTPGQGKPKMRRKSAQVTESLGVSALVPSSKQVDIAAPLVEHPPAKRRRPMRLCRGTVQIHSSD